MGGGDDLEIQAPEFQEDPRFGEGINRLQSLGGRLTNLDFTGDLAPLAPAIQRDPEITSLALEQAQAELGPAFDDTLRQIRNEAAANNQLESSTFTNALAREAGDLNQQFQAITSGAALQDRTRAIQNRLALFGTGLNATGQATAFAGQNQQQENQFNLNNFENQLGLELFNRDQGGGVAGGITGAIGGGLQGFAAGGPIGAVIGAGLGGFAGSQGSPGTGGGILQSGAGILGQQRAIPGSTAGALEGGGLVDFDDFRLQGALSGGLLRGFN